MKSNNILAATSLFCSRKNWPALLGAILTFTEKIYSRKYYCLELNYLSGENIRFSFLTNEETAEGLLKKTDEYFKDFFLKVSVCPTQEDSNKGIFKLFEQNTICYGLYEPIIIRRNEKKNYLLQFALSEVIMDVLKDEEELDDEGILTFAYYLMVTVIKTAVENGFVQIKVLLDYFEFSCLQTELHEKEFIETKFKDNKLILQEIFDSIGEKNSLGWIEKWKAFIEKTINQDDELKAHSKIFLLFNQVKIRLGFNKIMEMLLCCFLFRILSEKYKR